jgi:phosphatidylglycerophosphate synthase
MNQAHPEGPHDALASRRPIAARKSGLAQRLVHVLLRTTIAPNQVSVLSVVFAALGAVALLYAPGHVAGYVVALIGIQLRLLCNLLDGMLAVEGGRASGLGPLYNEFPDRIADTLLIVCLGYAAGMPTEGWAGALAAALTAYVRVFGGALGQAQDFRGPMAKQHRMAVVSIACVLAPLEKAWSVSEGRVLEFTVWVVLLGSLLTCVARTRAIAARLAEAEDVR